MPRPVENPPNPFHRFSVEWLDVPPDATLTVYEEEAKSVLSKNNSPDVGFTYSVNPYRGCFHACAYCYARPSHQYLDFGAGTDFERKIVVKVNAPSKLKEAFDKPSWKGDEIVFSGNTDCYQPLEGSYELTRRCLSICAEYRNPVGIITKGALIERDLDVLVPLHERASLTVFVSLAFFDDQMSKAIEPSAPRPSRRFRTIKVLADAGVRVGVGLAPVIPGLNDYQIPAILEQAQKNGARFAFMTLLRLPGEVKPVFFGRLKETFPDRYARVVHAVEEMREGKFNDSEFHSRMAGKGQRWEAVEWLFQEQCRRLGLNEERNGGDTTAGSSTFSRPRRQLQLFE